MGNIIKFQKDMRTYIRIVEGAVAEQADADDMYGDVHPDTIGPRNGQTFTDQGRADIDIRQSDARFADNPMEIDEFVESDSQLDQLHQALSRAGLSDLEIRQGIDLSHGGKEKIAGRLGISPEEVDTLLNSLTEKLRDADASDSDALLSDYYTGMSEGEDVPMLAGGKLAEYVKRSRRDGYKAFNDPGPDHSMPEFSNDDALRDREAARERIKQKREARRQKELERPFDEGAMMEDGRFSIEPDSLGNITIRDLVTGKEKFLQATDASNVMAQLNRGADPDRLLEPLMEVNAEVPSTDYTDEINADSGSYNFEWNDHGEHGTGTVIYSMKNGHPDLKMASVRDAEGDDIMDHLDQSRYQGIFQQAKEFIGKA